MTSIFDCLQHGDTFLVKLPHKLKAVALSQTKDGSGCFFEGKSTEFGTLNEDAIVQDSYDEHTTGAPRG